jgi:hypothetical protein
MGDINRARAFVEDFLAREPDYFGSFARPFLSMIDAELSEKRLPNKRAR